MTPARLRLGLWGSVAPRPGGSRGVAGAHSRARALHKFMRTNSGGECFRFALGTLCAPTPFLKLRHDGCARSVVNGDRN